MGELKLSILHETIIQQDVKEFFKNQYLNPPNEN
jgi:hypothetical protein